MIEFINRIIIVSFLTFFIACKSSEVTVKSEVPKKAKAMFSQAYEAYSLGEYSEAEILYKKLIKKYPNFTDAYDALGTNYRAMKKPDLAISTYRTLINLSPQHFYGLQELGELYAEKENMDSAAYYYKAFLKFYGGSKSEESDEVRRHLLNVEFAKAAIANPIDIIPINLGEDVNSVQEEYSPMLTIDEKTLYYTLRDGRLHPARQNEDIVFSKQKSNNWLPRQNIGSPINTVENEGAFSVSSDGNYIFYTACSKPGGLGQCDIWLTMNKNGSWTTPGNLGKPINSKYWESQPSIASNGQQLYFVSDRPEGYGGTDIWVSNFGSNGWEEPINLGREINTAKDEQFPFIHSDGTTLYFSSEGHIGMGKSDLYVTHLKPDNSWEKPKNLGYPINTIGDDWNLIVSRDGETAFYSTNRMKGGFGGMDLYTFKLPKEIQAQKVNYARGFVRDAKTKQPLGAAITLTPIDGSTPTFTYAEKSKKGEFIVALVANTQYALTIDKPGYLFHSEHFDMPNSKTNDPLRYILI